MGCSISIACARAAPSSAPNPVGCAVVRFQQTCSWMSESRAVSRAYQPWGSQGARPCAPAYNRQPKCFTSHDTPQSQKMLTTGTLGAPSASRAPVPPLPPARALLRVCSCSVQCSNMALCLVFPNPQFSKLSHDTTLNTPTSHGLAFGVEGWDLRLRG